MEENKKIEDWLFAVCVVAGVVVPLIGWGLGFWIRTKDEKQGNILLGTSTAAFVCYMLIRCS